MTFKHRNHSWSLVVIRGHSWSFVVTRGHSCVLLDKIVFPPYRWYFLYWCCEGYKNLVYPSPRAPIDQYIARKVWAWEKFQILNCFKLWNEEIYIQKKLKFRGGRNREAGGDANQVFFYLALVPSNHILKWAFSSIFAKSLLQSIYFILINS
jgi:hypothetical protein